MIKSKLTRKARTTIPKPVRAILGIIEGDELVYTIEADGVVLTKAVARQTGPTINPFTTFAEWDSDADRSAFADL